MFRFFLSILLVGSIFMNVEAVEVLDLDIIPYEKLAEGDSIALQILDKALHEKGIVGIRENQDFYICQIDSGSENHHPCA